MVILAYYDSSYKKKKKRGGWGGVHEPCFPNKTQLYS